MSVIILAVDDASGILTREPTLSTGSILYVADSAIEVEVDTTDVAKVEDANVTSTAIPCVVSKEKY